MSARPASTAQRLLRLLAAGAALGAAVQADAAAAPSDLAVKAAFMTKFAGYATWPPPARPAGAQPLVLCMVGGDPFGRLIEEAARGQQVSGHTLQLRRVASADGAAGCHVAFVQSKEALDGLQSRPVLTVTDARAGPHRGMIHFVIHQGRVRFHIDEAAAARSGIALNARLLGVALSVRQRR